MKFLGILSVLMLVFLLGLVSGITIDKTESATIIIEGREIIIIVKDRFGDISKLVKKSKNFYKRKEEVIK